MGLMWNNIFCQKRLPYLLYITHFCENKGAYCVETRAIDSVAVNHDQGDSWRQEEGGMEVDWNGGKSGQEKTIVIRRGERGETKE